ncbi:MAG: hypothetical protein A2X86_15215 [Bdellovibrionales bacterium GWA2_49_15]|nr:MAG: hypothetical protein A2X86_15215 [Bdellovibrionales bacterium GWA2_49_15]HAZ13305.1 hypothetical protein [Bdellovibrionales bacterium]
MNTEMTTTTRHIFLIFFLIFLITSCSTAPQGSAGSGDSLAKADTSNKVDFRVPVTSRDRH